MKFNSASQNWYLSRCETKKLLNKSLGTIKRQNSLACTFSGR